ncbi:MAG: DUF6531 domain-containing protein, partial [Culicoidibacterales bacterium]
MKKFQKRIFQFILLTLVGAVTLSLIPQASWLALRQMTLFSQYGNAAVNHMKKLTEQDVKPQQFSQPEIAFSEQPAQLETGKKKNDDAETVVEKARQNGYSEVESKRTSTSTTFDKGNGEEVVIVSSSEINYKDKDGKMVPVDTEIREQNGQLATASTENLFSTAKELNQGISFGKQEEQFQFTPEKEAIVKKVENNTITYTTKGETLSFITIDASNSGYTLQEMIKLKDTYEATYTLKTSLKPELSENKQRIVLTKDGKQLHIIGLPHVEDTQGHLPEVTGGYQLEEKGNGQWKIHLHLKLSRLEGMIKGSMPGVQKFATNEGFVANVSLPVMKILPQGQVKMYGIRQVSDPNYSYGPVAEVQAAGGQAGGPEDRMIVGQDDTGIITGLVNWSTRSNKALIRFDLQGQSWKDYIGSDQELVSANLKMNVRTHNTVVPAAKTGILTTVNRITTDYGNPARTSWNSFYKQNVGQEAVSEVLVKRLETGLTEFASFDIQNAITAWMAGQPDYGLILGTDAGRGTYAQFYMNHLASNGASRPYLELTTKKKGPVPLDLSLDQTTLKARAFSSSDNNGTLLFQALGFDGVVRPGATVDYRIVEENDKSKVIFEGNAQGIGANRVFPYYTKDFYPLQPKWQNYYKLESNWQGAQMVAADKFQKDKLYRIQYKTKAVIDGKESITDWKDNDTFQTYSVRSFDRLPRLLAYYGVEDNALGFRIDNHLYDYLLMEKNEIFIRNPKKNGGSAYSPDPLSDEDKRRIDGSLMGRGKHCKFGFEPITMNTGNWFYSTRDIEFYEYGERIAFERNYNSLAGGIDSMIGRNWSFAPFADLGLYSTKAEIKLGDGNLLTFDQNADGTYKSPQNTYETLTRVQIGESTFTEDNNYYDAEATPIRTETKLPKYQFIMK